MPFRLLFSVVLILCTVPLFSQEDSVEFKSGEIMADALYLNYYDFRRQNAISKEQIVSEMSKEQLEFISKTVSQKTIQYKKNGATLNVESKDVWGFFQNNTFHINFKGDFYRVPVFGPISYFVATITVVNSGMYDPRFGYQIGSATSKEVREFLFNFYNNQIIDFTLNDAELLLSVDKALYTEFKNLSHRKQKEMVYGYIRRYNQLHPIYFLK